MELDISWEEQSVSKEDQKQYIDLLRAGICEALLQGGGPDEAEIGVVMVDDETIHLLNKTYRGVDRPTDVLSFAMMEKGEGEPDIISDDLYYVDLEDDEAGDELSDEDVEENYSKNTNTYSLEVIIQEESSEDDQDPEFEDNDKDLLIYEDTMLGDIVISVETARVQAVDFGHSLAREIVYLAVHGTFHLLGYDHDNDENRIEMRRLEEQVMEKIGLPR